MKRLIIAATLALGALVAANTRADANGNYGFGIGIGLNFTFSYKCSYTNDCYPPSYGCGSSSPYSCQGGGYPMPGYGEYDPGMAPQGYAGYPSAGGQQAYGNYNGFGATSGTAYGQPAPATGGYGGYTMPTAAPAVYATAE